MHNKNVNLIITMKGENSEVLDDTYTITSNQMRRNFTRKIALHTATCTSECYFNIVKFQTFECQIRETLKWIVFSKEFNWDSCRDVKPSTKIYGKKFSRKQPEVNLRLTKEMREELISLKKDEQCLVRNGSQRQQLQKHDHTRQKNAGSHQEFLWGNYSPKQKRTRFIIQNSIQI